ncbi:MULTISPECIES: hypothetical protein [unclassified Novosphingobium]|uniref:hypothetical protein n=1 Tax=unclassified Novosphingobium TaxID=2644732 RepID=UPI0006C85DCF|nr:hypothetical protein [Novosphingobium sp. ST904]TCM26161.1 hypothetical protein EDF59_1369 [Novosphingobium sp. ST904]
MLKSHALQAAARTVAEKIVPLESSLDESFSQTAGLLAYLPQARLSAGLPMETGHAAIVQLVASLQSITDARGAMIAAHAALAGTRNDLRLPETGFGSLAGCPSSATLQVVREHAA